MKALREMDSAGWGVFGILFVILAPLLAWGVWYYTLPTETAALRVAAGIFLAGTVAAFLTYGLNQLLWQRQLRLAEQEAANEEAAQQLEDSDPGEPVAPRPAPAKGGKGAKKGKKKKKRK